MEDWKKFVYGMRDFDFLSCFCVKQPDFLGVVQAVK